MEVGRRVRRFVLPPAVSALCLLLFLQPGASAQALADVSLFGHRGFARTVPENSMAALQAAVDLGLAGAEIDLRTTRDGHVVLMHDPTVDRTTTGAGGLEGMTREEVGALRLRSPDGRTTSDGVPDLEMVLAFLDRNPKFRVAFDAKSIDVAAVGRRGTGGRRSRPGHVLHRRSGRRCRAGPRDQARRPTFASVDQPPLVVAD